MSLYCQSITNILQKKSQVLNHNCSMHWINVRENVKYSIYVADCILAIVADCILAIKFGFRKPKTVRNDVLQMFYHYYPIQRCFALAS